jgi:hypothetical protein
VERIETTACEEYTHPPIYESNSFDENVRKVKILKSKIKFPLISMWKILTGFRRPEKLPNIFPTFVRILYNHKNKNSITFMVIITYLNL